MLTNKKSRPSHSQIAEYWKDKYISRDFDIIDHYEDGADPVIEDRSIPSCMACGFHNERIYSNPKYEKYMNQDKETFSVWNLTEAKCILQRCHVIPRMVGGENQVSNYFLLCKECHQESPDYMDTKFFFAYIRHVRYRKFKIFEKRRYELLKACYDLALQMNKNILHLEKIIHDSRFLNDKMSFHITSFSPYTIASAVVDSLEDLDVNSLTKKEYEIINNIYSKYDIDWESEKFLLDIIYSR